MAKVSDESLLLEGLEWLETMYGFWIESKSATSVEKDMARQKLDRIERARTELHAV